MSDMARLNVTWGGANGDLPDPVAFDTSDRQLREIAREALLDGSIPGIPRDRHADLSDFVVDRFQATDEIPHHRIFIRPKTPFGS